MKQFKYLLITLLFVGFGLKANAQRGDRYEKIKAMRVAYYTDKLALSSQDAEKFWPIYNDYLKKDYKLRIEEYKEIKDKIKQEGVDNLSESEANNLLDKMIVLEAKRAEERSKLIKNLRNVISVKKILQLKKVEDDFNRQLFRQLKNNRSKKNKE